MTDNNDLRSERPGSHERATSGILNMGEGTNSNHSDSFSACVGKKKKLQAGAKHECQTVQTVAQLNTWRSLRERYIQHLIKYDSRKNSVKL